jgi:hypothetical protein
MNYSYLYECQRQRYAYKHYNVFFSPRKNFTGTALHQINIININTCYYCLVFENLYLKQKFQIPTDQVDEALIIMPAVNG